MSTSDDEHFVTDAEHELQALYEPYGPRQTLPRTVGALERLRAGVRTRSQQVRVQQRRVRTCPVCATVFQGRNTLAVYCTPRCKARAWTLTVGYTSGTRGTTCVVCNESFEARRAGARYCGDECRRARHAAYMRAQRVTKRSERDGEGDGA